MQNNTNIDFLCITKAVLIKHIIYIKFVYIYLLILQKTNRTRPFN